jgi:thymidylate synthase
MRPVFIEATTLDDAWHQAVYNLFDHGTKYTIDQGSYSGSERIEFDFVVIHIKRPAEEPRIPRIPEYLKIPPPTTTEYVAQYFESYIMSGRKGPGEDYTYGERLVKAEMKNISSGEHQVFSQIDETIERYKKYGPFNNQLILQIASPSDLLLDDPPCLRHIDTKIRDGALHFFPYFRSWDLWGGFPANLAALQLLKEYMASEIGVNDGEIIAASKGLHIYRHVEELARLRFGRP